MKSRAKNSERGITREQARRLAAQSVIDWMLRDMRACDGERVKWNIAGVRQKDTWLVYRKQEHPRDWMRADDILMVVCKRTGRVLLDQLTGETEKPGNFDVAKVRKFKSAPPTGKHWLDTRWWE